MTVSHKNLPDSELHEPKGINTAGVDTVYVADGSGSGDWKDPKYSYVLDYTMSDVSSPSTKYVSIPINGKIKFISCVLDNSITSADSTLVFYVNGTAITGGTVVVSYSGSAAGSIYSATPTSGNDVTTSDYLKIVCDGGSSTTSELYISIAIEVNGS